MRFRCLAVNFLIVGLLLPAIAQDVQPNTHAGVWRWAVKTGQDAQAADVDFSRARKYKISTLSNLSAPGHLGTNVARGVTNVELRYYEVLATVVKCKLEADGDYHVIVQDSGGRQLGCEIVQPAFSENSAWHDQILQVRQDFEAQFGASTGINSSYRNLTPTVVKIRGVGFWDATHGQKGLPNGFELHPVLQITFVN